MAQEYSEKLKKYIEQAKKSFATSIEERIKRMAKEEREGQLYGAEKLQQAGKFTSGFRPGLMAKIMDIFAGRRGEMRGEYDERAMAMAMQLLGLGEQAELTREGYALQKWLARYAGRGEGGVGRGGAGVSTPTYGAPTVTPTKDTSRSAYDKERADFERRIQKAARGFLEYETRGLTKQPAYPIKGISPTRVPYHVDKKKPAYY